MFSSFLSNIEQIIRTQPLLAIPIVFLGWLMTAANPCVLTSIPLANGKCIIGMRKKS
jgi:cytochrome c biogenesis protein CcdA